MGRKRQNRLKNNNENLRPDNAVKVSVSVGALTKTNAIATDDTQRQFNQGDQISVSTNDQEAVLFQCTSTDDQTWTEAVAGKFLLWTQDMLTFSAYYPATTGTSMTTFTLPTDQSSVDKIALADYMTRQQVISRPEVGSDIQMQLERKMARVIVRISGFGNQYFDDQKTVKNVRIYSEASGIADGNPTGSSTEIQPYAQGSYDDWSEGWSQNSTFTALVVPGYGDSGARFIQLTDGEGSTLLVKGIPELEAGNSYTFNLVVGKNRIEVASVTVQDWATGETLAGGQAEEGSASTPLDNTTTAWSAGTFAVPAGGLTYSAAITVSGDVTLVLTDGETLTLNKGISLASGATLTIQGTGTMNVNGTNNNTSSTVAGTGTLVLTSGTLNAKGGNGQGVGNRASGTDNRANAGGTAINGNVTVSGGTLTATGGNGGGVGERSSGSYGAAGGVAISGSVTVTDGTVTATGGNGGSIGASGANEYGGNGGAAIGGDATISGGTWTATDGTHGVNGDGQGGAGGNAVAGTVTDNR